VVQHVLNSAAGVAGRQWVWQCGGVSSAVAVAVAVWGGVIGSGSGSGWQGGSGSGRQGASGSQSGFLVRQRITSMFTASYSRTPSAHRPQVWTYQQHRSAATHCHPARSAATPTATQPSQQPPQQPHTATQPQPLPHPLPHSHSHCHARKALVQHQRPVLHPPPIPHNSPRELNLPLPPPVLLVGVVVQAVLGARGAAAGGVLRVGGRG
jgi:hypothetical protein